MHFQFDVTWTRGTGTMCFALTGLMVAVTRIAVLPMGYWDGYPRLLSSRAHALVNGQRCPVLGRVMMNHVVIDVTRAARGEGPPEGLLESGVWTQSRRRSPPPRSIRSAP